MERWETESLIPPSCDLDELADFLEVIDALAEIRAIIGNVGDGTVLLGQGVAALDLAARRAANVLLARGWSFWNQPLPLAA